MNTTATYFERAKAYAHRVVAGEEVAGLFERLACQRFMRDLERQGTDAFPYVIDERLGSRACRFVELMPHIKGEWAKPIYVDGRFTYNKIKLEDWQVFIEFQLFAWVHQTTRLRRFRRSYEEIARKNAKSTRIAARELYLVTADGEPGAHCYSAATTGEQAREVFDVARNMAIRESEFRQRFGVDVGKHDITIADTASSFKPLNAEGSTLDGLNVHGGAVDEVHAHKKRDLWDVLDSATGARSQALLSAITTAGTDRAGICYELRDYTIKVLQQVVEDETWFGIIFTIDDGDVWHDPKCWRKANPNLGISVKLDDMEAACRKAKAQPSAVANFLTKRLNVWVSSSSAWMNMEEWKHVGDRSLNLQDFLGRDCYGGLDLAEKKDFAALELLFTPAPGEQDWYFFTFLYHNEDAIKQLGNAHMQGWADQGFIKVNPGNLTDLDNVATDLEQFCAWFNMIEVAFDPAKSMYFATKLMAKGVPMVEIRQAPIYFTQPLIQIENLTLSRHLHSDGNPVFDWMMSNVEVITSKFSGLKHPTKAREASKIDGPVALMLAAGRAMSPANDEEEHPDIEADYEFTVL